MTAPLLYALSGFCALGYEVVWAKTLALCLGGTAASQAAVLACFLGGLAAGSALLGKRADAAERPLAFFARLELGIALCGYAAPWVLSRPAGLLLVLVAAFLMGGTLPALARALTGGVQRRVAVLGAINNAGAAAGALTAGFVLIPRLGLTGATHLLAGLGLAVAAAAALTAGPEAEPTPHEPPETADAVPGGLFLWAVFLSGLVTLSYEAAWVRLLAVVLGASAFSFTVMVAGFVGGMGLGAWAASAPRLKSVPASRLYAAAQLGAGLSVLAAWPLYERLPWLFWRMSMEFPKTPGAYPLFEAAKLAFCFALTLPPTFFLGAAFPAAARAAAARRGAVGAGVGLAAAAAAAGNVLGAGAAGLVLLPLLGVQGLLTASAAANLTLGAALLLADGRLAGRGRAAGAALAGLALAAHGLWGGSWDRLLLAVGTHRYEGVKGLSFADYLGALRDKRVVLFQEDDAEASVSVLEMPEERLRALMIDGKADASTGVDMGTQVLLGTLPFALVPRAKTALLVGLGSGVTAGSALLWPLERLDVCEISPAVVRANGLFAGVNRSPLADPRLSLHVGDGRAYLRGSARRYDAVVSEPSNPWIAGVGNLFTEEYFRLVRSRLAPGGVMVQWFHTYEAEDEMVRSIVGTFARVFDSVSLWRTNGGDAFVVGSNGGFAPDFAATEAGLAGPPREALASRGLEGAAALFSLQTAGDAGARALAAGARINSDRRPFLEYAAPRGRFLRSEARVLTSLDEAAGPKAGELLLARYLAARGRPLSDSETASILGYARSIRGDWRLRVAEDWTRRRPGSRAARLWVARMRLEREEPQAAMAILGPALAGGDAEVWSLAAQALGQVGEPRRAREASERAARLTAGKAAADPWTEAALHAMDEENGKAALDDLERALKADPGHPKARSLLEYLTTLYR